MFEYNSVIIMNHAVLKDTSPMLAYNSVIIMNHAALQFHTHPMFARDSVITHTQC
jgi:hypothetical protein